MAGVTTTRISFGLRHQFDWSAGNDWPLDLTLPDLVFGYFGGSLRAATPAANLQATAAENTTSSVAGSTAPPVSVGMTQVLYLQEVGDATVIAVTDINQGQIGDCFLLASIGELALWHSSAIANMIHVNADGTETVTLYVTASGQLPTYGTTSFKPTFVTIDNTFPSNAVNSGASQGVVGSQKEIWVQVLEKAVATLNGGYNAISNGGNPMIAMEELTGQSTTFVSPGSLTLQQLQGYMAAGSLITVDTAGSGVLPYGLVNSHAYMFESLTIVSGIPTLQLGNPWGYNNPQPIPLSQLASAFVEVDIGTFVDSNLITGGTGNDITTLSAAITSASVDLGAGGDVLTLADGTNSATVANTETIIGGTGDDSITLGTAGSAISIDLAAGNDVLSLGSFANAASVSNVETLIGGSGTDTVTLGTALTTGMSVDLAGGRNKLTLAGGGNTGTVKSVATLLGGAGADSVTFGGSLVGGSVDLGASSDTLTLANFTNRVSTANVETVLGGTGNDTVTLTGAAGATVIAGGGMNFITGSSGADTVVFNQNAFGSTTWVKNFSTASGDKLALDTTGSSTLGANTFDLGGAALILDVDLASVTDVVERLTTTLNNGGKGAFLYEQDTGELCYSADGSFAAGGTLIGVITTDGVTPWNFSANDLMQV